MMSEQPAWRLTAEERQAVETQLPPSATQADYLDALLLAQIRKVVKWLEDGRGEWHHVPEAGRGECYCIYAAEWKKLRKAVGLD